MRAFSNTTTIEPPSTSNRRQPVRQTRANPSRNATNVTQLRGAVATPQVNGQNTSPGFFPAITHFTDSIAALPKEMIRNYTMLKEVDAKIYGPEELLGKIVTELLKAPVPPRKIAQSSQIPDVISQATRYRSNGTRQNDEGSSTQAKNGEIALAQAATPHTPNSSDLPRRRTLQQLRFVLNDMLSTLDEKNHVMSTANDELNKQLARCKSSYVRISDEVSEEARYGSLNHWAYTEKAAEKKGTLAGERTRRDTAANSHTAVAAASHDLDGVISRSEARRETLAARKQRNHPLDSDFDDTRLPAQTTTRKAQPAGKGRRAADPPATSNTLGVGLGIANGPPSAPPPSKRRKIEKPAVSTPVGGLPMERGMSSVYGSNMGSAKGAAGSPRETPTVEVSKKRGRATTAANGTSRRRANTNNSAANSPLIASSPIAGTFAVNKDIHRKSPAPSIIQRAQPSRGRQNSTQSAAQDTRNRPSSSTSNKTPNVNGVYGTPVNIEKASSLASRIIGDTKPTTKETKNPKSENVIEEINPHDGAGDPRSSSVVGPSTRVTDRALKREETENGTGKARPDRDPSITVSTRGSGKLSKTTTPLNASFSEPPPRSRPSRTIEPPVKRSHKKGAGLAAQLAAAAAAANNEDEGSSMQGDEDEDEDDSEPRYCYCNQVSYGEMVACDMETCAREWFHLDCAGLTKAPTKNAKWFCDECKDLLKKGKLTAPSTPTTATVTSPALR